MNQGDYKISIAGENSLIIYFDDRASDRNSALIAETVNDLKASIGCFIIDLIPSYASLLVIYDSLLTDHYLMKLEIEKSLKKIVSTESSNNGTLVELPVYYSPESGPDLQSLSKLVGLSTQEIIELHQSIDYRVYAMGFAPGFAYLGEIDSRIAAPRLQTPRLKVPAGSVAIADRQTAVYPCQSPGGWNLIGLCPETMFDMAKTPPTPIKVGDRVRFQQVTRREYMALGGEI